MPENDLDALAINLEKFARMLPRETFQRMADAIGEGAVKDAERAVRETLGDRSMSGWMANVPIGADYTVTKAAIVIHRSKTSAGQFRVLEQGRHMGESGGFLGPGVSKDGTTKRNKNGALRKVRARKAGKQWNGYTRGKGTWSDAVDVMLRKTADRGMSVLAKDMVDTIVKG